VNDDGLTPLTLAARFGIWDSFQVRWHGRMSERFLSHSGLLCQALPPLLLSLLPLSFFFFSQDSCFLFLPSLLPSHSLNHQSCWLMSRCQKG
jgi:hypothetical protein